MQRPQFLRMLVSSRPTGCRGDREIERRTKKNVPIVKPMEDGNGNQTLLNSNLLNRLSVM
jgi:hypothetical protein